MVRAPLLLLCLAVACGESEEGPASSSGGTAGSGGSAGATGGASSGGSAGATGGASSGGSAGSGGTTPTDAGSDAAFSDLDGDGLDDATELALAQAYYPYYSIAPDDKCPRHGVLFRATPHPADATKLALWYVVLFEKDCGANGHVGDDEVFGAVIDPKTPPPAGILALRAISHQGTLCEKTTTCGSLTGCSPCKTAPKNGQAFPVVFASVNKHGGYVDEGTCDLNFICDFGGCTLNPTPAAPPFANAGEPGKPLTNDLTQNGFINSANGWTEQGLMGFDPWSNKDFGSAGNVTDDLGDPAFVIAPSGC
ncbi:MAG: hypothetical protein IPM35_32220 [Myxococcales bacterium]|nr:hypothetical protein [Myxococcales bacterium]